MRYPRGQRLVQFLGALVFLAAGIGHFLFVGTLARFIPPYLPAAVTLVFVVVLLVLACATGSLR